MSWSKFDDQYPVHRKMLEAGVDALGFDVAGICFCNRYDTDGEIADHLLSAVYPPASNPKKLAQRLVDVGRWERIDGGYLVHDYLDYNPSAAEVADRRALRAVAGRKGGSAKQPAKQVPKQSAKQSASRGAKQNANPVSRIPVPERDISKSQTATEALIDRLDSACQLPNRGASKRVVETLLEHVDARLVDECVGWAMQRDESKRPRTPSFFETVVRDWAAQRGIKIPHRQVTA